MKEYLKKYQSVICIVAAVCLLGMAAFCGFHVYDHYAHQNEQTEAFAPKDYSWSAKNIMPWTTYSKVQNVPEAVVLVDTNTRKIKTKLEEDWPGAWEKIKFYGQWTMMIKHR